MNDAPASSGELVRHLERAAEWRLLAQVFAYPEAGWVRRLELLSECVPEARLAELAASAAREGGPGLWMRLFGPAGAVRLRAVSWESGLQPGYLLAELAAFYEAFGFAVPAGDAPDSLPVLLDFAAWLEMKLAYACVRQDPEAFAVTAKALETFRSRFLSTGAWRLFRRLEGTGPAFLIEAARAAAERSGAEPTSHVSAPQPWPDISQLEDASCGGPAGTGWVEGPLPAGETC
jgi:nitrate reductase assembly molybdenum cofactor insertion protein NarJ